MITETNEIYVEAPVVTIDKSNGLEEILVVHTYINHDRGKMFLNKAEAGLLLLELYKFIKN